ncbi:hypothetical protein C8R46DRAFT_1055159 [Mycena filopes]|nr:hypothetical protein C8R46DRAFT_1055159 [Mycena filopes]
MFLSAPIYIGPERISGPGGIRRRPVDEEVEGPQRRDNSGNDPPPLLDLLAFLQAMSPNSERNKALGNVLGLVHGSDGTAVRPPTELENAMTLFSDLRASGPHPPKYPPQPAPQYPHHPFPPPSHPSQPATASSSHSQHRRKSSSTDDEIVVLNKENVNPTVFRRRSERDGKLLPAAEPSTAPASLSSAPPASSSSSSGHPLPASLLPTRPPPPSLLPPRPFLTQSQPSRLALSNPSSSQPLRRKRTLSEFMEEQEAARERERASKKDYYRQPERSMSEGDFTFFLKTKSTTTAKPTRRPQVRRRTASTASSPGPEVEQELPVVSASSPPRPPRRKFTLPDWARTDTATQPRLAEDLVLKVQEDEKKKKEDERKKREAKRKEVRAERVERGEFGRRKRQGTAPPAPAAAQRRKTLTRTSTLVTANGLSLPAPVAASGEFPAFTTTRPPLAPVGSPSRSMSKSTTSPCTPPRKRRANTISTPGDASLFTPGSALFTPASASWEARGTFDLGRRSMSPTPDKSTQSNEEPESDEDDNLLGQELNSAFDELDFPSNSLPVASSDNDAHVETEQLPNSSPQYSDDSDNEGDAPPKQHWVGLPPSSPPPPSSPYLGPSATNEDDVEELPVPTSDAEPTSELNSPSTEITNYSIEELGQLLNIDDLANFFPAAGTDNANVTLDSAVNLLDQFAENNHLELASSDSVQTMKDWGLDQVNPDFDFTEFWESVRPLVEGGADPNNSVASSGMEAGFALTTLNLQAMFTRFLIFFVRTDNLAGPSSHG